MSKHIRSMLTSLIYLLLDRDREREGERDRDRDPSLSGEGDLSPFLSRSLFGDLDLDLDRFLPESFGERDLERSFEFDLDLERPLESDRDLDLRPLERDLDRDRERERDLDRSLPPLPKPPPPLVSSKTLSLLPSNSSSSLYFNAYSRPLL